MTSMNKSMITLSIIIFVVLVVGGLIAVLFVILPRFNTTTLNRTPEQVISSYLEAIQAKDYQGVLGLIAPNHNASASINEKMENYGGVKLENIRLEYKPTESPYSLRVFLYASTTDRDGKEQPISDMLYLDRQGQSWFLILGTTTEMPTRP